MASGKHKSAYHNILVIFYSIANRIEFEVMINHHNYTQLKIKSAYTCKPKCPIRLELIYSLTVPYLICSIKRLGIFLLPPGWDASPSQD